MCIYIYGSRSDGFCHIHVAYTCDICACFRKQQRQKHLSFLSVCGRDRLHPKKTRGGWGCKSRNLIMQQTQRALPLSPPPKLSHSPAAPVDRGSHCAGGGLSRRGSALPHGQWPQICGQDSRQGRIFAAHMWDTPPLRSSCDLVLARVCRWHLSLAIMCPGSTRVLRFCSQEAAWFRNLLSICCVTSVPAHSSCGSTITCWNCDPTQLPGSGKSLCPHRFSSNLSNTPDHRNLVATGAPSHLE